ncbi:MAG: acyltransferase [Deltaproteobacteria bacterium]|nr:acyltransferase [Deltaproteobacteria bacterium]
MADLAQHHAAFREAKFFPALDGLRAISILVVIWHHAGGEGASGILARGFHGVSLFFAISGFLITTLLLREQDTKGQISLSRFYLRRTLRIFPLYYLVLGVYTVLVLVVERGSVAGQGFMANLPSFLTYTSNWLVSRDAGARVIFYFAWSLATEEQFYLLWPSVVRFARRWWTPVLVRSGLVLATSAARGPPRTACSTLPSCRCGSCSASPRPSAWAASLPTSRTGPRASALPGPWRASSGARRPPHS